MNSKQSLNSSDIPKPHSTEKKFTQRYTRVEKHKPVTLDDFRRSLTRNQKVSAIGV